MRYRYYVEAPGENLTLPPKPCVYQTVRRVWFKSFEEAVGFQAENAHKTWRIVMPPEPLEL